MAYDIYHIHERLCQILTDAIVSSLEADEVEDNNDLLEGAKEAVCEIAGVFKGLVVLLNPVPGSLGRT